MKKAYLYRLYPREEQAALLQQQLDVAREVYNACLLERREAYRMAGVTLNYYAQANQLKALPRGVPGDRADIAAVNFSMLQAICRRAQRAYDNFFRRVKAGQPAGLPRFKSKCIHATPARPASVASLCPRTWASGGTTVPAAGFRCHVIRSAPCSSRRWALRCWPTKVGLDRALRRQRGPLGRA